jgi:hypothetical protein
VWFGLGVEERREEGEAGGRLAAVRRGGLGRRTPCPLYERLEKDKAHERGVALRGIFYFTRAEMRIAW